MKICEDRVMSLFYNGINLQHQKIISHLLESIKDEFTCEDKAYAIITNMMEKGM